jgi:hypothetical protein
MRENSMAKRRDMTRGTETTIYSQAATRQKFVLVVSLTKELGSS